MKHVMVRYKVKAERRDEHIGYIQRVFEQLQQEHPARLHYAAFHLDDGLGFVHVASIDTPDGQNPLTGLAAFKAFTEGIKERCDEPPVAVGLTELASYRGAEARFE